MGRVQQLYIALCYTQPDSCCCAKNSAWFLSILSCLLELRDFQVIFYCGSIVVTIVPRLPEGNPWISGGKLNRLGNWITQEQQKMTTRYNKEYLAWGSRPSNMGGDKEYHKKREEKGLLASWQPENSGFYYGFYYGFYNMFCWLQSRRIPFQVYRCQ